MNKDNGWVEYLNFLFWGRIIIFAMQIVLAISGDWDEPIGGDMDNLYMLILAGFLAVCREIRNKPMPCREDKSCQDT